MLLSKNWLILHIDQPDDLTWIQICNKHRHGKQKWFVYGHYSVSLHVSVQKISGQRSFSVCSLCGHGSSISIQIQDLTSFISKSYTLIHRLLQGIRFSGLVLVFNLQWVCLTIQIVRLRHTETDTWVLVVSPVSWESLRIGCSAE